MKKLIIYSAIIISTIAFSIILSSCQTAPSISSKLGVQIWSENCIRCHNSASPATFSDVEWDVAAMHMQIRANLTHEETRKVIEFLQSAN